MKIKTATKEAKLKKQKVEKKIAIKNIYEALLAFQSEKLILPRNGYGKTRDNKQYKYVTLDDMIQHAGPVLQKYGMGFTQIVQTDKMETKLFHAQSGTEIQSTINLGRADNMQDYGGRITYAKRYALGAILGLSSEEDIDAAPAGEDKLNPQSYPAGGIKVADTFEESAKNLSGAIKSPGQGLGEELVERATKPAQVLNAIMKNESEKVQRSESFNKASLAIGTAYSAEALELIQRRIDKSVTLSKEEIVELQQMIIARETEVEGTVR